MMLKFAEAVQPYLYVKDMQYREHLFVEVAVRGCITLDTISVEGYPFTLRSQKHTQFHNETTAVLIIENVKEEVPQLKINFTCDSHWKHHKSHLSSQSHLVRMRTSPNYQAKSDAYTIKSQTSFNAHILNIRTTALVDRLTFSEPGSVSVLCYHSSYKARLDNHNIYITYINRKLTVHSDKNHELYYEIIVRNFGTVGCCDKTGNGEGAYMILQTNKQTDISKQAFLDLLGRTIELRDLHTKILLETSTIETVSDGKHSPLLIPENGLTASSGNIKNYYYVTVKRSSELQLRVEVLTGYQGSMKFDIENHKGTLQRENEFVSPDPAVTSHFSLVDVNNLNEMRIRGSQITVYDLSGNVLFKGVLNLLNSEYNELESLKINKASHKQFVKPKKSTQLISSTLVITLIALFFIVLVVIIYIKRKESENQRKSVELQKIDLHPSNIDDVDHIA